MKNNDFSNFPTNYWAQISHPLGVPIINIFYFHLLFGLEGSFQFAQFYGGCITALVIFSICRVRGQNFEISLLATCLLFLNVNFALELITSQNDIILASFFITLIWFAFYEKRLNKSWSVVCAWFSMFCGILIKFNFFLYLLPVIIIVAYYIYKTKTIIVHDTFKYHVVGILTVIIGFVCGGYYTNYSIYGNIIGPSDVLKTHGYMNSNFTYNLTIGLKNAFRYIIDSLNLDGSITEIRSIDQFINNIHVRAFRFLSNLFSFLSLDENLNFRGGKFNFFRLPINNPDSSYFGIVYHTIFIPGFFYSLFRFKNKFYLFTIISIVLILSFQGQYNPWHGRYFIILIPLLCILSTDFLYYLIFRNKLLQLVLFSFVILLSLTFSYHYIKKNIVRYISTKERLFNADIFATIAMICKNDRNLATLTDELFPEYCLIKPEIGFTLFPINNKYGYNFSSIPLKVKWLVYSDDLSAKKRTDVYLGVYRYRYYYLRKIN